MASSPQHKRDPDYTKRKRQEAGKYIRRLRIENDLTQVKLAEVVGIKYYTFITQIESGKGRVPPEGLREWAAALKVDPVEFAWNMLSFYDPETYSVLKEDRLARKVGQVR
ncbi:helix-turn-helix domain-containing protein [Roseibium alexandrii]|uniref:helix-turn-helix domain-containing protein n=1 Tax=Roseibium alexandrii TaxID=388408 RepID=UPI00375156B5